MKLADLAAEIEADIVTNGEKAVSIEIESVYAGDRISDMLNEASDTTLFVTNLTSAPLIRVAELMDVPALCLLNGEVPEPDLVSAATQHGTVLLVSPVGMFVTCGRLYGCLTGEGTAGR